MHTHRSLHMDINAMFPSKFLKKEDFDRDTLLTIRGVKSENVAQDDKPEEYKPVLYFTEREQGLALNRTNAGILMDLYGSETDNWRGKKIVAYNDTSIMFQGKRTGGIRLRPPKNQPAPAAAPVDADNFDDLDDPPF